MDLRALGTVSVSTYENTQIFECPSEPRTLSGTPPLAYYVGYGYNCLYLAHAPLAKIQRPAETVMFCDAGKKDDGSDYFPAHVNPPAQPTYTYICRRSWRHNGGVNVAFVDGHVKWYRAGSEFYPATAPLGNWTGNGVWDPHDPNYKNQLWDRL